MWGLVLNRYFLVAMGAAILTMLLVKKRREDYDGSFINTSGVSSNITKEQAEIYANALYVAMYGPGTREGAIERIVDELNAGDWALVNNEFGVKKGMSLYAYLDKELSVKSDSNLRFKISELYRKNGISSF